MRNYNTVWHQALEKALKTRYGIMGYTQSERLADKAVEAEVLRRIKKQRSKPQGKVP